MLVQCFVILSLVHTIYAFKPFHKGGIASSSRFPRRHRLGAINQLEAQDNEVFSLIQREHDRQRSGIELIASENFVSPAVQAALSSCLTNKYSEGRPGRRYYGGTEHIDALETLCEQRALSLFSLSPEHWGVNVQPYSGSVANLAVYTALLAPHERLVGLDLPSGGHLSHGYRSAQRRVSASSLFFESLPYRVDEKTGLVDYEEMARLVSLYRPKLLIAGASAYPRDWDYARMREIADSVSAFLMADIAHIAGLVAHGHAHNPFTHCDVVTTTAHKSLRGPRAAMIFARKPLMERIHKAVFPALQGGPHNSQIAALAVALREASTPSFAEYTAQVIANAQTLANELMKRGYSLATNGTDNHIVLWDLRRVHRTNQTENGESSIQKELISISSALMERLCEMCDISVNKNTLPGDLSALHPGGLRLGTLAMTTRGLKENDMVTIADFLHRVVAIAIDLTDQENGSPSTKELQSFITSHPHLAQRIEDLKRDVHIFTQQFPLPTHAAMMH